MNPPSERATAAMAATDATRSGSARMAEGEYVLQVHVIECKEMKGMDASGLGDISIFVEALGTTRHTETVDQVRSAVFDETLFFSSRECKEEYLEQATIQIKAMDMFADLELKPQTAAG